MAHQYPYPGYPHYPPQQHGAYPPPYGAPGAQPYPHYPPQPYGHAYPPQYPYPYPHQPQHVVPPSVHPSVAAAPHAPVAHSVPAVSPSDNASQTYVEQWCPNYADTNQIDQWFKEIDRESKSIVGGLEIAKFMQRSNLPRETLRAIWALVDNPSKGYINRVQFTTIIRLVSIACSPIYMGSAPSMERYYQTIRQNIPLPQGLYTPTADEVAAKAAAAAAAAAPVPTPVVAPVPAASVPVAPVYGGYPTMPPVHAIAAPHPVADVSHDDDMEFSDFAAAPPTQTKVTPAAPAVPISVIDDEDFGDFGSATSAPVVATFAAPVAALPTVAPTVDPYTSEYGDAYGYGGYGVEEEVVHVTPAAAPAAISLDLDDILGDFAVASAPAPATAAPTITAVAPSQSTTISEFDNAFGSFDLTLDSTPAVVSGAVSSQMTSDPPVVNTELSHSASVDSLSLNTPVSATLSAPNSAQPMIMRANSSHLSNNNLMVMSLPESGANKMSAFDDLAENDLQAAAEDWDEFEEADPNAVPEAKPATAAAPAELDLLDVTQHVEVTPLPSVTGSAVPSTSFATFGDDDDFGDDFGGFESAEFTPAETAQTSPVPIAAAPSAAPTVSTLEIKTSQEAFGGFGTHDDDEFGDFDSHTPTTVNSSAPIMSQAPSSGAFTPPPVTSLQPLATSTPTVTPVRPPLAAPVIVSAPVAAAPQPAPVVDDLLDFLSEPVSVVSVGPSTKTIAMFPLDSDDLFNAPAAPAPAAVAFDPFGESTSTSSSNQHNDFDPFGESSKPSKTTNISAPQSIKSPEPVVKPSDPKVKVKAMSITDLETLSLRLTEKHLYEEAYSCVLQTHIQHRLNDLNDQKREAMENDELDLAVQLKKEMTLLSQQVEAPDEEAKWSKAAQSNRVGDTIHETYDLVNSLNQQLGNKFKSRFLAKVPAASVDLEKRLEYFITARRYARMLIAICSTHTEYPAQWLKLLNCINSKIVQGKEHIAKFKSLKSADQLAVKTHPKMVDFVESIVQIAELGIWLSVSCEESFQHEKESKSVFASCQELLSAAQQCYGIKSKLVEVSSGELSISAAKVSERNGVTYCNLTLRPLTITKQDGSSIALYAHRTEVKGTHFMQAAINLWLKEVSPKLPKSECNFA